MSNRQVPPLVNNNKCYSSNYIAFSCQYCYVDVDGQCSCLPSITKLFVAGHVGGCGITDDVIQWMDRIQNSAVEEDEEEDDPPPKYVPKLKKPLKGPKPVSLHSSLVIPNAHMPYDRCLSSTPVRFSCTLPTGSSNII
jgi:hypothetical protein